MGTVSAHLCLRPWSTVPPRVHTCDFHGAVLSYLRQFPSHITWNQVPRVRSTSYLCFSVWSLANGWSRSSKAQQRCPVSGEIQRTIYTIELPDSIRPRSGNYLKSLRSLASPFLITALPPPPFVSFFLTFHYPSLLHIQSDHRLWLRGNVTQTSTGWAWPLRWLPGATRQSLIRLGVCSCCWFRIPGWTDWSTKSQHWYCRLCLQLSLRLSLLLLFWRSSSDRFPLVASKKILIQIRLELPNAEDRLMRRQNTTQTHRRHYGLDIKCTSRLKCSRLGS